MNAIIAALGWCLFGALGGGLLGFVIGCGFGANAKKGADGRDAEIAAKAARAAVAGRGVGPEVP